MQGPGRQRGKAVAESARRLVEDWLRDGNIFRSHSALGYRTLKEFADAGRSRPLRRDRNISGGQHCEWDYHPARRTLLASGPAMKEGQQINATL